MSNSDPYHAGEHRIQALAGQARLGEANGRAIAKSIIPGAWGFLAAQNMLVLGSWDGERGAWPSIVFGAPGFVKTQDGKQVSLTIDSAWSDSSDPLWRNLQRNRWISILAIELSTRRRLRINGHLSQIPEASFFGHRLEVIVDQSYPNCPKYIQRRILRMDQIQSKRPEIKESTFLSAEQKNLIVSADTFFVASVHRDFGTDVSHRGGNPGFVDIKSDTCLRIPDYVGNGMFNTLGNIHESGFAGLLFIDFDSGRQIQIVGDAQINWTSESTAVERTWQLDIHQVRESLLPHGLAWELVDYSSFNPMLPGNPDLC
ncbi:MAG: pyridoxamine 5'-phosphate oxidase family protein [Burkholderiales bacterium]|nr:pyridoxamine 5'-phosphate oxidase family protein [Burkholderiales bacterium]